MASPQTHRESERRGSARLWAGVAAGALGVALVGMKASTGWLDIGRPSAEPAHPPPPPTSTSAADAQLDEFALSITRDADAMWARDFRRRAKPYTAAEPVLLDAATTADCGPGVTLARQECFGTNKAYIDRSFQRALEARFGSDADGAQAYAVAHELGHHVQRVLGMDKKIQALLATRSVASQWVDVQLELQADCLAGVWSRRTEKQELVAPTKLEAALRNASDLGKERQLAQRSGDASHGESFTYAVPRRRVYWFAQGYAHGEIDDCDTFAP